MGSEQQKTILLGSQAQIFWEEDLPQKNEKGGDAHDKAVSSEFAALFEKTCKALGEIKVGTIIQGTVTHISGDYVIVDIGHKTDGEIPLYEFSQKDEEGEFLEKAQQKTMPPVKEGDVIDVFLETFENQDGQLVLSYEKAQVMKSWDRLGEAFENEEVVSGRVVRRVKGGLHVDVGVRAFLPGSQIDLRPVKNLDELVGEDFQFKIIKFNKSRSNVVLSRRVLLESDRAKVREKTIAHLKEGLVMKGVVKNLTNYGAFVDLGGVDGLLHITDMSWGRVNHPSQLFDIGQEVEVIILSYNPESLRVSLGHKQLQEDPWNQAVHKYEVGSRSQGVVVSLTDYGAFVELEEGIEGLIHISEMSWSKRIRHPSKLVSIGDQVEVVILGVDPEAKRISLGMKQLEANPWESVQSKYKVGDTITGKVRNITDFGIFVAVEDGIDALVHISDISWTERTRRCVENFHRGQEVEAQVLQIDTQGEKFSLGIKQLTEDPWNQVVERYTVGSRHTGVVSKVINFGVFVKIPEGFEGLIHVSELSADSGQKRPIELAQPGQEMPFVVLNVDSVERKISLSKKAYDLGLEGEALHEYMNTPKTPHASRASSAESDKAAASEGATVKSKSTGAAAEEEEDKTSQDSASQKNQGGVTTEGPQAAGAEETAAEKPEATSVVDHQAAEDGSVATADTTDVQEASSEGDESKSTDAAAAGDGAVEALSDDGQPLEYGTAEQASDAVATDTDHVAAGTDSQAVAVEKGEQREQKEEELSGAVATDESESELASSSSVAEVAENDAKGDVAPATEAPSELEASFVGSAAEEDSPHVDAEDAVEAGPDSEASEAETFQVADEDDETPQGEQAKDDTLV